MLLDSLVGLIQVWTAAALVTLLIVGLIWLLDFPEEEDM